MPTSASAAEAVIDRQIVLTARTGPLHRFLSLAETHLAQVPRDTEVRLAAVQGYAALGLRTPGRRLIAGAPLSEAERARLATCLPPREQRVAWSGLASRFAANLEVFDRKTGMGAAVSQLWSRSATRLELYRCRDGCYQVFSRLPDAPGWLPALAPHDKLSDAARLRKEAAGKVLRTLALAGLGLGYAARDVIAATHHSYQQYSAPVIIVERSLLAWAVVLHLFDWRELLVEPRVEICAGPDALAQLDATLRNVDRTTPMVLTGGLPWPDSASDGSGRRLVGRSNAAADPGVGRTSEEVVARVAAASQAREQTERQCRARVDALYANCDAAWWAQRFAQAGRGQPPLSILGITSRYTTVLQYSMRDWLAAFDRLGHRTFMYIEPDDHSHFSPTRVLEHVEQLRPDLVLIIDHLQSEYPSAFPEKLPGVCWIQDSLAQLFSTGVGRRVRPLEFVIGFGIMPALVDFEYPRDRFLHCEIPTNPQALIDPHEQPADLEPYRCDVMYATHYAGPLDRLWQEYRGPFDAVGRRLIDAAYERVRALAQQPHFVGDYLFEAVIEQVERDLGMRVTDQATRHHLADFLWRVADRTLREAAIAAVAEWALATGRRFHLYGHGWEQHPQFARFARGVVEHGLPLGRAYRAAKINLHTGCNPALHRRVLDGLAGGGFFLIRAMPSDTMYEFWPALHQALAAKPDQATAADASSAERGESYLRPDDVDEPARSQFHHCLKLRGYDPDVGVKIDRRLRLYFALRCERRWLNTAATVWPRYAQVVFRDERHLIERIEHFLSNEDERRELAGEMRAVVLERFTYDALAARLLEFVQSGLAGRNPPL